MIHRRIYAGETAGNIFNESYEWMTEVGTKRSVKELKVAKNYKVYCAVQSLDQPCPK